MSNEYVALELPLNSEVPGLHVRRIVPVADRSADPQTHGGREPLGTAGRQHRSGWQGIGDPAPRRRAVVLIREGKRRGEVESGEAATAGARRGALDDFIENTVPGADHDAAGRLIRQPDPGAEVIRVDLIRGALTVAGEFQAALERRQAGDLQRRGRIRVDPALPVIPFGAGQREFIPQTQVQREAVAHTPVILDIPRVGEILGGHGDIDAVAAAALGNPMSREASGSPPVPLAGVCAVPVCEKLNWPAG